MSAGLTFKQIADAAKEHGAANTPEEIVAFALGFARAAGGADSTAVVDFYFQPISPNVLPVWLFLEHCKIPHKLHFLDLLKREHLTPEFLAVNPYHTIPAISHDGFRAHESNAILRYLCRAFPSKAAVYYGNFDHKRQCTIDVAMDERQIGFYSKFSEKVVYAGMGFAVKETAAEASQSMSLVNARLKVFHTAFLAAEGFVGGPTPSIADFSMVCLIHCMKSGPFFNALIPEIKECVDAGVLAGGQACMHACVRAGRGTGQGDGMTGATSWKANPPKRPSCGSTGRRTPNSA
jgi:glutathione S-transferase